MKRFRVLLEYNSIVEISFNSIEECREFFIKAGYKVIKIIQIKEK